KRSLGIIIQGDISAQPRFVINQMPAVTAAGDILSQQYVTRMQNKALVRMGFKLESPLEGNDVLDSGRSVPVKAASATGFTKRNGFGNRHQTTGVVACLGSEFQVPLFKV